MKYLNCLMAQYFLTASIHTQKLDQTLTPGTVRRLSYQNVPLRTRPKCTLHFLSSPFGRAVFPKMCLNFILRKSPVCHLSRFVADSSYGGPILLSLPQRVTVTFHPLIPSAFSPLADLTLTFPSARPFNLNKTAS